MLEFICLEKLLETNKKIYRILLVIIPILIANIHASVFLMSILIYLPYIAEIILSFIKSKIKHSENKCCIILHKILNKFEIEKRKSTQSLIFFAAD